MVLSLLTKWHFQKPFPTYPLHIHFQGHLATLAGTIDGSEILHHLIGNFIPRFGGFFLHPRWWSPDFFHQQYQFLHLMVNCLKFNLLLVHNSLGIFPLHILCSFYKQLNIPIWIPNHQMPVVTTCTSTYQPQQARWHTIYQVAFHSQFFFGFQQGSIKKGPFLGGIKQYKSMAVLRDFTYNSALWGLVI